MRKIQFPREYAEWEKYFEALAYYEANRLRWKGFEFDGENMFFLEVGLQELLVRFQGQGVDMDYKDFKLGFYTGLSLGLFELICQENNITL